jgi:hypothetical protein
MSVNLTKKNTELTVVMKLFSLEKSREDLMKYFCSKEF